ncbi:MAG TPA: adenylate/guanylate cyclase domain-containing protein [Polyangia bacterium]|jgi:class 3 adenylate cyclase
MTDLGEWLRQVGLEKYAPLFAAHEITLDVLPHLTDADIDRLGLPIGPRRRLTVEVQGMAASALAPPIFAPAAPQREEQSGSQGVERRQLTVMFCDLVGSTALAERLDPEELRDLIQAYRSACGEVVSRYDGHVAQYLGDGLMVYFGWPSAHEDDVERAVRSALEIVQAVKQLPVSSPLAVRIGLATGPVVVGEARLQSTEAKLAVGGTPNLAARLQALASSDQVVIAPTTRRLVGDVFALTDLGTHPLKGIEQPVRAWRVDAVRRGTGRFEAAHVGMDLTPLVGREDETALLSRLWQQARQGQGQVVSIGGEPGIGKSHLTESLREHVTEPHTALRYQCSPYHLNSELYPFIEQFEYAAGFAGDDSAAQKLDKLEALLAGTPAQRTEWAPLFAALLSLPAERYPPLNLSPHRRREKTLEAIVEQLAALVSHGPVLIVVEDLHWVDPTSQELLAALVQKVRTLPVMMVTTHRLEYVPPWARAAGVTNLTLGRLGWVQGAQLVGEVSEGKALPPELLDEILARADGVPLFVEQLTKSVLESGLLRDQGDHYELQAPLAALAIPTSLRDSLMARLDRLAPVKEIAQIGACIGREFSFDLLARVSTLEAGPLEAALDRLADAGLVIRRDTPPDVTYTFKHALVQDAAYESLLKSRRSEVHARIAYVLENDFADRVANKLEWLAHHHTQAGNLGPAIPLWREAGTVAVRRVALQDAVAHFQKGLGLIAQLPPSAERDRLELTIREPLNAAWTGLRGWAAPEVEVNAEAILRLAQSQGNVQSLLLALWCMWTAIITQGRIADSLPWARRMLAEGREAENVDFEIFGHAAAMVQHFLSGELAEARTHADRVFALYDPARAGRWLQLTGHDLRTFVEVYTCQLIWMQGFPDQAVRASQENKAHAQQDGHAFNLAWALTFSAYTFAYRREPQRFLEQVGEADRLAREQGIPFIHQVSVPQAVGVAEVQNGRPLEAIALLREGIESWTRRGGRVRIPYLKSALAEAVALEGDLNGALVLIDECLEQIERPAWQERLWLAELLRLKAWMLMRKGNDGEAETLLRASLDCARRQQAKSWELRGATTLATLLARTGRGDAARDLLAPIHGWFTEGFDTKDLREARALLDQLSTSLPLLERTES